MKTTIKSAQAPSFGIVLCFLIVFGSNSFAGSATWDANPATNGWNTATNWTPQTVPNGSSDVATFATSNTTAVSISAQTEVNGITFNSGASAFAFTIQRPQTFTISGVGITNDSGTAQNFVTIAGNRFVSPAQINFTNNATAGTKTVFTNKGEVVSGLGGGLTQFSGNAAAGDGMFINEGGTVHANAQGGTTQFRESSTAGNGTFINNPNGAGSGRGGTTQFRESSTAGNGTFINNPSGPGSAGVGLTLFFDSSSADTGHFTNNGGRSVFFNTSSAGNGTFVNTDGGLTEFSDNSTAANSTFTNNGATVSGGSVGETDFDGASKAGSATFTTNGGTVSGALGGMMEFLGFGPPSADNGTFIVNGGAVSGAKGGIMEFFLGTSTAGNATIVINGGVGGGTGGTLEFFDSTTGGTARVEVFGNGSADIGCDNNSVFTFGSIEGNGSIFLGANNLELGSNNRNTTFAGLIADGGICSGPGGSLSKVGAGTLTLSGANTYTGGTAVNGGKLLVTNTSGSGTGSGAVQVNAGTLGGRGRIGGAVTIGTGSGPGAILSPGSGTKPGTLTIHSPLVFNSDATYDLKLNSQKAMATKVAALGVTINNGALFSFTDFGGGTLAKGTVFTVINNTSANPIFGTFSDLPDGSTFSSGTNTFKASYEGGTGNDLTLTVQ